MNCKIFLIIGAVGLGLMAKGALPLRAAAAYHGESKITMAQLPTVVAKTLTQEAAGGYVREIDRTAGDHQATYEAEVVVNKISYEIKISMDGTLLKKQINNLIPTMNHSAALAQGTIKQVMRNGNTSDIGEQLFYEIGLVVRWLSIIAALILVFIFCKACGVFGVKSLGSRQGTGISTIPQATFHERR